MSVIKKMAIFALVYSGCFAQTATNTDITALKSFYIDLGKKEGRMVGYKEGYNDAIKYFKKLTKRYKKRIKAMEAGKYLIESGKITYPQVFKIRRGSSYEIKIKPPVVEREFNTDDLFIIPLIERKDNIMNENWFESSQPSMGGKSGGASGKLSNTFDFPDMETTMKIPRPNRVDMVKSHTSIKIPFKSSAIEKFMNNFGAKWAEISNGYIVNFSNMKEKHEFCKSLTGDKTCRNLYSTE